MDGRGEQDGRWNERAVEAQVEPNGGWNGKGEHERRASNGRWIAFSMAFIAIGVGHVRHNTGKVNQSIENVSDNNCGCEYKQ